MCKPLTSAYWPGAAAVACVVIGSSSPLRAGFCCVDCRCRRNSSARHARACSTVDERQKVDNRSWRPLLGSVVAALDAAPSPELTLNTPAVDRYRPPWRVPGGESPLPLPGERDSVPGLWRAGARTGWPGPRVYACCPGMLGALRLAAAVEGCPDRRRRAHHGAARRRLLRRPARHQP